MPSSPSGRTRSAAGPRPSRSTRWGRPDEGEGGARRAHAGVLKALLAIAPGLARGALAAGVEQVKRELHRIRRSAHELRKSDDLAARFGDEEARSLRRERAT